MGTLGYVNDSSSRPNLIKLSISGFVVGGIIDAFAMIVYCVLADISGRLFHKGYLFGILFSHGYPIAGWNYTGKQDDFMGINRCRQFD